MATTSRTVPSKENVAVPIPDNYVPMEARFYSESKKYEDSKDPSGYSKYINDLVQKILDKRKKERG